MYIPIVFEDVKGFNKLTNPAKEFFKKMYQTHNNSIGKDCKKDFIPVKVKEYRTYLKVTFVNGEWLHYANDWTWY
jgi:hypothetical protein